MSMHSHACTWWPSLLSNQIISSYQRYGKSWMNSSDIYNCLPVEWLYYYDINIAALCVVAYNWSIGEENMKIAGILLLIFVTSVAGGWRVPAQYRLKSCKDPVACVQDPCQVTACPKFPKAKCVSNFCGGCNAHFFVGLKEVTSKCQSSKVCANI